MEMRKRFSEVLFIASVPAEMAGEKTGASADFCSISQNYVYYGTSSTMY
jgi:hypothetical protein